MSPTSYCSYYRAHVVKKETWFFVAILRSYEHLAFDRTFDKGEGIFELFVTDDVEDFFVDLLKNFHKTGVVTAFEKLPNRLLDPSQSV